MQTKTFSFVSKQDGLNISALYVKADVEIKAILQIAHGMAEHKERYLPFMEYMANAGYLCVIMDMRGHGASVKSSEDLGYFYETSGTYMVEDAHQLTLALRNHFPGVPLVLFGHSMGSLLVRAYTKRYDGDIDALVVCGSPSKNLMAKLACTLVRMMRKFKGERYRSPLIQNLAFGAYAKKFHDSTSENRWLSCEQMNVQNYDEDPLCGFTFTLNGFENLFHLLIEVYDENGWKIQQPSLPIFFIAGSEDPCIGNTKSFTNAYSFLRHVGYEHIDHRLIEGKRHEILNEENNEDTMYLMKQWMDDKIDTKSSSIRKKK